MLHLASELCLAWSMPCASLHPVVVARARRKISAKQVKALPLSLSHCGKNCRWAGAGVKNLSLILHFNL